MSPRRRQLLLGLAALGSGLLPSALRAQIKSYQPFVWRTWSGGQRCIPEGRVAPDSEPALIDWLRSSRGPLRPVGAGHSFSPLVPTSGQILSIGKLSGMICYDEAKTQADFWAGTRLSEIGEPLLFAFAAVPDRSHAMHPFAASELAAAALPTPAPAGSSTTSSDRTNGLRV